MTNLVLLPPIMPLEFRAIGIVRGRYLPSQKKITRGTIVMEDGTILPANLTETAGWLIKLKPELIETEHVWVAWPRTDENVLHMQLKNLRLPLEGQTIEDVSAGVDYFSVRGEIVNQDPHTGTINIRICRNIVPPEKQLRKKYQPFILAIEGFLPGKVDGQFWDFDVSREGNKLILEDANFMAQIVFELPPKEEPKKGKKGKGKQPPGKPSGQKPVIKSPVPKQSAAPAAEPPKPEIPEVPPAERPPNLFKKKKLR